MVLSLWISRPGVSFGTRNMLSPLYRSSPVRAMSAIVVFGWCAPEHHVLLPLITHSSPSRRALVISAAASEPAPGSLMEMLNF